MFFLPWYPDILPHARLTPASWLKLTATGRMLRFKGDLGISGDVCQHRAQVFTASHTVLVHGDAMISVAAGLILDAEKMFEAQTVAKGKASGGGSAHAHCPALLSVLFPLVLGLEVSSYNPTVAFWI